MGGGEIRDARLDIVGLGEPYGDERIVFRGEIVLPVGGAAAAPASAGLQTMLRDAAFPFGFGMNGALDFNAADGNPVYRNRSGALDPPVCTADSARGLRRIRIADARPAGGIRFRIESRRATVGDPLLPLLAGVVLGAFHEAGAAGSCALRAFARERRA